MCAQWRDLWFHDFHDLHDLSSLIFRVQRRRISVYPNVCSERICLRERVLTKSRVTFMCVCSMISKGLTVEIWYATKEHEGKHNSPLEWQSHFPNECLIYHFKNLLCLYIERRKMVSLFMTWDIWGILPVSSIVWSIALIHIDSVQFNSFWDTSAYRCARFWAQDDQWEQPGPLGLSQSTEETT